MRHKTYCLSSRERTATSNKENKTSKPIIEGVCAIAQTTPLDNRGCCRPVHGDGSVCASPFIRVGADALNEKGNIAQLLIFISYEKKLFIELADHYDGRSV